MPGFKKHKSKIQTRILVITLSCILGMCALVSSLSYFLFSNYMQESLRQSTETNLYLLADDINTSMTDVYRLARFCQTNSNISAYIEAGPEPDTLLAVSTHDRIYEEFQGNPSNTYIPRLAVITDTHFLQIVDTTYSTTDNLVEKVPALPYYDRLMNAGGHDFGIGLVNDPFLRRPHQVLPVLRPISYPFRSAADGYVYAEISSNLFIDSLKKYTTTEDTRVFITMEDKTYLYEDGALTEAEDFPGDALYASVPLNMSGCSIGQTISQAEVTEQRRLFLAVIIGIIVGLLGIGFLLINIMNRMINVPISQLQEKMRRVSAGNFERDSSIEWEHELGDIGRGINDLAENVNSLMKVRLEDEKQKKDLEYKMLQSQINPHFIYNTLNSIKWMATIQGADGISEITTSLSRLLKSISKGTSLIIPLREELNLMQDYFLIQRYRYGGTIAMETVVEDERLYNMEIIKFTLQPLLENAVFHGIEPKGGAGKIDVHIYFNPQNKDEVIIDVTDDGVGIPAGKIDQILTEQSEEKSDFFKEIGLKNVNKRLQYEFGDRYGITVTSEEGKYTTMSILLPYRAGMM